MKKFAIGYIRELLDQDLDVKESIPGVQEKSEHQEFRLALRRIGEYPQV